MAYCVICGDERNLKKPIRFWDPDDGWRIGRLCPSCFETEAGRKPQPEDFAWDKRSEFVSDVDEATDQLFG